MTELGAEATGCKNIGRGPTIMIVPATDLTRREGVPLGGGTSCSPDRPAESTNSLNLALSVRLCRGAHDFSAQVGKFTFKARDFVFHVYLANHACQSSQSLIFFVALTTRAMDNRCINSPAVPSPFHFARARP